MTTGLTKLIANWWRMILNSNQQVMQELLDDPQASGGLLVNLPLTEIALNKLHVAGVSNACLIGQVITRGNKEFDFSD